MDQQKLFLSSESCIYGMQLYDAAGRKLKEISKPFFTARLDMSYVPGIYFLRIDAGTKLITKRVIIY